MTLAALTAYVHHHTGYSEPAIRALVQANWPSHRNFTSTQARLLEEKF